MQQATEYKWLNSLAMAFVTFLLVANVVASKPTQVFNVIMPAAVLVYPLTYLLGVGITEVYGRAQAQRVIWFAMWCNVAMALFFQLAIALPPAHSWAENQVSYAVFLGSSTRVVVASLIAYIVGQLLNTVIVSWLKDLFSGSHFWLRAMIAMAVSEVVGSIMFAYLAFVGVMPLQEVLALGAWYYLFKMTYAVIALPLLHRLVSFLKTSEGLGSQAHQPT